MLTVGLGKGKSGASNGVKKNQISLPIRGKDYKTKGKIDRVNFREERRTRGNVT